MRFFKKESGRTMVEMLGVLMIFAVLSIVGIAGYDEIKDKWRVTQTLTAVQKVYSVARSKGKMADSFTQRLPLPRGVVYIKAYPSGSVHVFYNEAIFSNELMADFERKAGVTLADSDEKLAEGFKDLSSKSFNLRDSEK